MARMTSGKYQNKYRISSARLKNWNYQWGAAYFITVCTHNRQNYFGYLNNGTMKLSAIGNIAYDLWIEIPNHTRNIQLDAFVVMPNHLHGILILTGNAIGTDVVETLHASGTDVVETLHATSLRSNANHKNEFMANISPKRGSLSAILRSYKSAVTNHANHAGIEFAWQSRFYDHIIRNNNSFRNIQSYIIENPSKWIDDSFYNPPAK